MTATNTKTRVGAFAGDAQFAEHYRRWLHYFILHVRWSAGNRIKEDDVRNAWDNLIASAGGLDQATHDEIIRRWLDWQSEWEELNERSGRLTRRNLRFMASLARATVWHRRHQFAVGQGGFHAAVVSANDVPRNQEADFREQPGSSLFYAYDCGSTPRLGVDRAIDELIKWRRGKSLDILFLSHFDQDHICGTPRLLDLNSGLKADTIVIPYVDHVERLIDFGRKVGASDTFFESMVIDPVGTLGQFEPRQIIMVLGDDEPLPEADAAPDGPAPDGLRGENWKLSDRSKFAPAPAWHASQRVAYAQDCVFHALHTAHPGGWRLVPYVRRAPKAAVRKFEYMAENLLGWPRNSFRARVTDMAVRRDLVTKHRRLLSRAYKFGFGDKNTTSLCLYSGPADPDVAIAGQLVPYVGVSEISRVSWMGTGDAELRQATDINAFLNHYAQEKDFVGTFMLPHHGSILNSDENNLLTDAHFFLAAAKPTNKAWRHPHPHLRRAVRNRKRIFRQVTAARRSAFRELIVVDWL